MAWLLEQFILLAKKIVSINESLSFKVLGLDKYLFSDYCEFCW